MYFHLNEGSVDLNPRTRLSAISDAAPIVFIVDDDVSVRESLEALFQTAGWKTRTFASAKDFLIWQPSRGPSCLVLDVGRPDLDGLDLQERVTRDRPAMPIIFITGYGDVPMSVQAMKAGAMEFLTKPLSDEALLTRVAIARSHLVLSEAAELQVLRDRYKALSRRERQVMALIVSGLLNKQVGGELVTSVNVV